jgi:hypothetical protein
MCLKTLFLQKLEMELSEEQPKLNKVRDLCHQLCDKAKDPNTKSDIRSKLSALEKDLADTTKKLGESLGSIERGWGLWCISQMCYSQEKNS